MENVWQPESYDRSMAYVSQFGGELLELLDANIGEKIIDWGCGTGDLAHAIAQSGAKVTGIDASVEMIERARSKYPDISFHVADGQTYDGKEAFDAVFSNAALHWMTDANWATASISRTLRKGGRFVAEFGAHGNIGSITNALNEVFKQLGRRDRLRLPWYFPTVGQYASLLEKNGMHVQAAICLDRPTGLTGGEAGLRVWLETFAGGVLNELEPSERTQAIERMEECLKPVCFREDSWVVDYRRLRIVSVKL